MGKQLVNGLLIMMEIRIVICLGVCFFNFFPLSLRSGFSAGEEQEKRKRKLMFSEYLLNAAGFLVKGSHEVVTS